MLIDDFITYLRCERYMSVHTVVSYETDLRQWADFATDGAPDELRPLDVTASDIRQWIAKLNADGLAPRSIKRKMASLNTFFKYLIKRHGLKSNPAADLTVARPHNALPTVIPADQTRSILDAPVDVTKFDDLRNHLIVNMLYQTGIRASELTSMLDAYVDPYAGTVRVLGKRNKERIIPIGDEICDEIYMYRQLRNTVCSKHSQPSDCFFVNCDGSPICYRTLYNIVRAALDGKVTVSKRSPHVLRHSFATDMLNNGAELNAVKELLGHQSLETTQIYTHISFSELKHNYELAHPRALKKGGNHGSKNPSHPL